MFYTKTSAVLILQMAVFRTLASPESSVSQLLMDPGNVDPVQMVTMAMELPVKMSMR